MTTFYYENFQRYRTVELKNEQPYTPHVDCTTNILLYTLSYITIHLSIPLCMHQSMLFYVLRVEES